MDEVEREGTGSKEEKFSAEFVESASSKVHEEWMKRNPKADYNADQHVPYSDLPESEKEKDRRHINYAIDVYQKGVN